MKESTGKVHVGTAGPSAPPMNAAPDPGSSLFIINLCASMAPITIGKTLPGLESYRLYQVARSEDGRTRHRLRLGFFTSPADADSVLVKVREKYPTAFTSCLCDEDRRFARGYVSDSVLDTALAAVKRPAAAVVEKTPVAASRPTATVLPQLKPQSVTITQPANKTVAPSLATPQPVTKSAGPVKAPVVKASGASARVPVIQQAPKENQKSSATLVPAVAPKQAEHTPAGAALGRGETSAAAGSGPVTRPPVAASAATPPPKTIAKPDTASGAAQRTSANGHAIGSPVEIDLNWDPKLTRAAAAPNQSSALSRTGKGDTGKFSALNAAHKTVERPPPSNSLQALALRTGSHDAATTVPGKGLPALQAIELMLESEPVAAAQDSAPATPRSNGDQPFHVGKGVSIPSSALTLDAATGRFKAQPALSRNTGATGKQPILAGSTAAARTPARPSSTPVPAMAPSMMAAASNNRSPGRPPPDLDSTQTIHALTSDELDNETQEKWFSIQLAVSEQPPNLDTMPHLDIFEAYRLYSVATAGSGKITHSLRLGFFRESVSAEAVSGYLKTFFSAATVVRISVAEQARFKDSPARKQSSVPDFKPETRIVELNQARDRAVKPSVPTVTMEVAPRFGAHTTMDLSISGSYKADATGKHRALKSAVKAPPPKRSQPATSSKASNTGRYKAQSRRSLQDELLAEAREVQLSESGLHKAPKSDSLLSRLVSKLTK